MADEEVELELEPEVEEPKPKPKKTRKPKPLVEGINAPKSTNDVIFIKPSSLTDSERKKMSEPRLLPNSVLERSNKKQGTGWVGVILGLLILVVGGIGIYQWYMWNSDQGTQAEVKNNSGDMGGLTPLGDPVIENPAPVNPPAATSTPDTSTTIPPAPVEKKLKVNSTPNGFLNVRSTPSTSGKLLTKVYTGQTHVYTEAQGGWYKITLPDKSTGWVSGEYVTPQ